MNLDELISVLTSIKKNYGNRVIGVYDNEYDQNKTIDQIVLINDDGISINGFMPICHECNLSSKQKTKDIIYVYDETEIADYHNHRCKKHKINGVKERRQYKLLWKEEK